MIKSFIVSNFRSINEPQTLSFEAIDAKQGEDYQVITLPDGTRLLRFIVLYGANASGKTNIMSAMNFVRKFIGADINANDLDKTKRIKVDSFKHNKENSKFVIDFYVSNIEYKYELEINNEYVALEKLDKKEKAKDVNIFYRFKESKRKKTRIIFNPDLNIGSLINDFEKYTLDNISIFYTLRKVNTNKYDLENVFKFFKEKDVLSINNLNENSETKKYILHLLQGSDYNIKDILVKKEKLPDEIIDFFKNNEKLSDTLSKKIQTDPFTYSVTVTHSVENNDGEKEVFDLDYEEESKGTKNTINFGLRLFQSLGSSSLITADEFENAFHPDVMKKLIFEFLNKKNAKSQMFITTHYDPLMEEIDFGELRPDSFYFTEKKADGSTELYALTDFRGYDKLESIRSAYRTGQLGALPKIY